MFHLLFLTGESSPARDSVLPAVTGRLVLVMGSNSKLDLQERGNGTTSTAWQHRHAVVTWDSGQRVMCCLHLMGRYYEQCSHSRT